MAPRTITLALTPTHAKLLAEVLELAAWEVPHLGGDDRATILSLRDLLNDKLSTRKQAS